MYKFLNNEGRIPAHTECPFVSDCKIKAMGNCFHEGLLHKVDFSCGVARAFETLK